MADRTVVYRLRAELSQFRAQMAAGSASVKKFGDDLTALDKDGVKTRRGLESVGTAAGRAGIVLAAGFGAAVVASANFDQAMSNVQAATHESARNMETLRQAALDAGASTVFSASEAAAAIENMAKAGVSTANILGGGLQGALDLAAAGSLEVADAAEIAATALTQFGLGGEDVPHVADLLAAGAGKAQGEVTDLAFALRQSGLVAAQMGLSIEETTGALSAFASAGLLGSDAGTSFRTMLLRLANPTKESKQLMDDLGIAAYDMQGNFVGIEALAGQLQTAFQGQTQATRDAALATIFGSDSIRAANVLYEQGANGIADWTNKVDDSGFAAETAAIKLDNLKGDLEALRGALETALIGTGEGSNGALRGLTQNITDVVNAYNKLPPAAQSAVGALLGGGALLAGSIWVGTKLIRGIADTRSAIDDLGLSGGKTSRAMRGLAKAGAIAATGLAALALVDAAQGGLKDYTIGVEDMTSALLDLDSAVGNAALPDKLDGLSDSIDRLANPNKVQAFQDTISDAIGGIGGGSELNEARAQIEALDSALAGLVSSGSAELAADALAQLADSQGLTSTEMKELTGLMPQYAEAVAGASNSEALAAESADTYKTALEQNTEALRENVQAMRDKREATLEAENAEIAYQAAIDDARIALRDNGKTLDITTEKGRANRTALLDLAAAWNEQSNRVKSAKGAHADAIGEFVKVAVQMGMNEEAARRYAKRLLEIPPKRSTEIALDVGDASAKLAKLNRDLDWSTRPRTIQIAANYAAAGFQNLGGIQRAQGGPVYGPGSATSDSIPAWLSNGEFVIKAAAVQRYGAAFFHQLNAMKLAGGGMVSRSSAPVVNVAGGQAIDYGRLAGAILSARPTYGNVTVLARDLDDFKRSERHDRQRAGLGGFPK